MRTLPDAPPGSHRTPNLGRAGIAAVAGAMWGLGLARFLAEGALWAQAYGSPLTVTAIALTCALVLGALARWLTLSFPSALTPGPWSLAAPLALPLLYAVGVFPDPLAGGILLAGGAALAALLTWADRPTWVLPTIGGAVGLGLYLRTLLPSVGEADTMEFQVVAANLGVAHPTGYPLYILLAKLFTLLPFQNVAWRVNLASATFAVAAVLVLFDVVRELTDRPLVSMLAALGFGFSTTFWSQAVVAEVYTLHNLFIVIVFWLLLRPDGESETRAGAARRWQVTFLLVGLSLTNHLTTMLLVPAVALALLWDRPHMRGREWLTGGALFLLGLSIYAFIPLRWPALNDGRWMTLSEFLTYVTGGQFHGALRLDGWQDPTRWRIVARLLHQPAGWVGICLAGLGVASLAVRRRRALALTGVTCLAFVFYGLSYYVADVAVFLLPAHVILAVWIGAGAAFLVGLPTVASAIPSRVWRPGVVALFALLPLSRIWINLPAVDRSRDRQGYAWGKYALSQPLAADGAVLADTNKFAPLYYLQQVEGVRPDLDIVLLGTEELYRADLERRLGQGQDVYLARYLPRLGELYLRSVGPLAEVRAQAPRDDPVSGGDQPLARFGDTVELLGAEVSGDPLGREILHTMFEWQASAPVTQDLVIRLRLVDADGRVMWTSEGTRPVNGLYPTNAWRADVPVSDYHQAPISPWLPPGRYRLEVGVFLPFDAEGLAVGGSTTPWYPVERFAVESPSTPDPLPHRRLHSLGDDVWLTGFDASDRVSLDSGWLLDLAWRGLAQDADLHVSWTDAEGRVRQTASSPVAAGMVRSRHTVTTPNEAGAYTLAVGLAGEPARCSWLAPPKEACPLLEVEVTADKEELANFGDRVALLDARIGKSTAAPGEVIPVDLRWRGLRSMGEDYTVFVHLVGPDGALHGQADSWPVQGSYPTSEWSPGEEVIDPHEVRLDADAPAGRYRVEVGWYLLETMQRLQVVGEGDAPVADSFVIGTSDVVK